MSNWQSPNRNREQGGSRDRRWFYIGALALTLISKYKLILPLLSKIAVPVGTMLASILAYAWATRSWGVALGIVAMIFIHEIGHVLAAKKKGLPVSAPIFIPFLGAFIAMKKHPRDAVTEAYIAIGGPVLGSLGALAAYLAGLALNSPHLLVIAYFGFFINLLNLLPIHPLDGGRIATAVSRWLWVVGLIGGLAVIVYLRSILFFIIWALFAWELYTKYVKKRNRGAFSLPFQIKIPMEYIRLQGVFVPGEEHQRTLEFVTYSERGGGQTVEVYWDSVGVREKVSLSQQYLINSVKVLRVKHVQDESGALTHVVAQCEMSGQPFENDRYYEVPPSVRWQYGIAYLGLTGLLALMMFSIHGMKIPGV